MIINAFRKLFCAPRFLFQCLCSLSRQAFTKSRVEIDAKSWKFVPVKMQLRDFPLRVVWSSPNWVQLLSLRFALIWGQFYDSRPPRTKVITVASCRKRESILVRMLPGGALVYYDACSCLSLMHCATLATHHLPNNTDCHSLSPTALVLFFLLSLSL